MSLTSKIRNPRWFLTIPFAFLSHKYNIQVYHCENGFIEFIPNWGSTLFILAMACAVAEQSFWPCTLRTPPDFLLIIYEIFISLIVINMIFVIVWIPLVHMLRHLCVGIARFMNVLEDILGCNCLFELTESLEMESVCELLNLLVALFILAWMLIATDTVDELREIFNKCMKKVSFNMGDRCRLRHCPTHTCKHRMRMYPNCEECSVDCTSSNNITDQSSSATEKINQELSNLQNASTLLHDCVNLSHSYKSKRSKKSK